jgi:DNA polymerase I
MITEIADVETDGFLSQLTKVWTIQIGTAEGDDVTIYADQPGYPPLEEGIKRLERADRIVIHNGLGFDWFVFNRFWPGRIDRAKVYDTLVAGRLVDPENRKQNLDAIGESLGVLKGKYQGDFQTFDQELVDYARQDIVVLREHYKILAPKLTDWEQSLSLEHEVAYIIALQQQNGFRLDVLGAQRLEADLRQEMSDIERELHEIFPPIYVGTEVFTPKKDLARLGYVAGCPLTKVKLEAFNPGSGMQIAERFKRKYKWKPKAYTPTGSPKMDEEVIAALPFDEAKALLRYARVEKMLGQLADGKAGWLKLVDAKTNRVHGAVNTNGAVTGRMSHFAPNMAQVDKDARMRSLWIPRDGWKLVGCDAEGLEARMLAHYLWKWDNGAFAEKVINGKKEDGTDVHTSNLKALEHLGMVSRDGAKTFLYALMYGAGDPKLGKTIKEDALKHGAPVPKLNNKALGERARAAIANSMVGIDKLTAAVKKAARVRGYVKGLDGRKIWVRSEHSALNTLLQGGGAIVMKEALRLFHSFYDDMHGGSFAYCANVHDEVQMECSPDVAESIGKNFATCISQAGTILQVRCPLAGSYDIGSNWKETH